MNPRNASRAAYTENEIANDNPAHPHASRGARSYGVSRAMRCVASQCRAREIERIVQAGFRRGILCSPSATPWFWQALSLSRDVCKSLVRRRPRQWLWRLPLSSPSQFACPTKSMAVSHPSVPWKCEPGRQATRIRSRIGKETAESKVTSCSSLIRGRTAMLSKVQTRVWNGRGQRQRSQASIQSKSAQLKDEDAYAESHSNSALSAVLLYRSLARGWPQRPLQPPKGVNP